MRAELEQAQKALKLAWGALMECSPCADPECKQTQQEWLDEAMKAVEKAWRAAEQALGRP